MTMTANELKKQGKIVEVFEGYTRYLITDDGRTLREGSVKRIRSKYVWIDDENGVFYSGGILRAYYEEDARPLR